jgi:hypothetical protein
MDKIYKLTQSSLEILQRKLKDDFDSIKNRYVDKAQQPFVPETDGFALLEGHYEIPSGFTLIDDKDGKYDFDNSKLIYSAFDMLTPSDADDARLWVYLTHVTFYNYAKGRWTSKSTNADVLIDRFFYQGTGRGTRTKNAISRLWWTAHLTVRKDESDEAKKWELTKAIFSSQDLQVSLLERAMGSYENVRNAFLEFYILNKSIINGKKIQMLARDLNNSGGVYLLSLLSKDEITKKLEKLLVSYPSL